LLLDLLRGSGSEHTRQIQASQIAGSRRRQKKPTAVGEEIRPQHTEEQKYQQALIEEYETTQEDLTSANEELQSTNEELQSTNEELETAKEELQSANEEMTTVNDELQTPKFRDDGADE
jgi:two-component system CheB/CheR fusion protein